MLAVLALFTALLPIGTAQAEGVETKLVAQSRATAVSADKAGALKADADPAPSTDGPMNSSGVRVFRDRALFAYDCPTQASACFYSGLDGTGSREWLIGCGFVGLGGSSVMDNVHSLKNQRGASASLYNWNGKGYELKGWVVGTNPGTGNFHANLGVDVVNVFC
ncbi:hypothetical protein JIG36_33815 [Actinoplanes sp. LDG1-06]|uniref:Uncharacterized protein n=1 Tax=Paractinoplanes ovalisporus TaxID=2810368 RepID=A0ABS2AM89_9ACTN|nr:hypothetical protein [Actinoplanes ovalisporus]MBM2620498.1 hypothetical protein [Actinoplanes ovalisporus]